ncbi:MAG: hypothetical protein IKE21_07155 [Erysipelotrichaceae bacterium]|nr:hypothetical protein [Erysipelotrichaceae bacterium]
MNSIWSPFYGPVKPSYKQDLTDKRIIEFAYRPDDEKVVLLGSSGGYYPYWISETDIRDIETNTAILESMLHQDFSSFTDMSRGISRKLKDCYRRRIIVSGKDVKTPFDHGYAKEQPQYWSRFIAGDICSHYRRIKELCRERELEGRYLGFLETYLEKLETETSSDPVKDYEGKKILMDLIRSEDYLLVSDNQEIRDTYIRIRDVIAELYNSYMSIVR